MDAPENSYHGSPSLTLIVKGYDVKYILYQDVEKFYHVGCMLDHEIIHPDLLFSLASLGHKDMFAISDAGLPIPVGVKRIDLAYTRGKPQFLEIVELLLRNLVVEKAVLAEEIKTYNKRVHETLLSIIDAYSRRRGQNIEIEYVPHEKFKSYLPSVKFVVRTGEYTPYSNIILVAGVLF
jgi:D-ribose pyranase